MDVSGGDTNTFLVTSLVEEATYTLFTVSNFKPHNIATCGKPIILGELK